MMAVAAIHAAWSPVVACSFAATGAATTTGRYCLLSVTNELGQIMLWRYELPASYTADVSKPTQVQQQLRFIGALDACTRAGGPYVSACAWKVLAPAEASEGLIRAALGASSASSSGNGGSGAPAGGLGTAAGGSGVSHDWGRMARDGDTVLLVAGARSRLPMGWDAQGALHAALAQRCEPKHGTWQPTHRRVTGQACLPAGCELS